MSLGAWLLDPSGLTPHGFCLSWAPGLIALHAGSDAVVGLSYLSIPLALAWFVRQRRDLGYRWVFYAFVGFILACGSTHLLAILTLWVPAYGIEGLVKFATALLSVATAALLWPLIPRLVALPSPSQLHAANAALSRTIAEQERTAALLRQTEARVRTVNTELEQRVAERTAELLATNAALSEALAERTRAQQALARSEEQFRASFEAAAVGKVLTEPVSRRIVRVNPALAAMLGYAPDELRGRNGLEILVPEDRPANEFAYARLLSSEIPSFVHETRCLRRDGTALWTRLSTSIARDPETGEPTLNVGLIEDIDARYRAEADLRALNAMLTETVGERDRALQALALSEAEFRAGFEAAAVGNVLTEPDSARIVRVNRAYAKMFGYEPEELVGRSGLELLFAEDREPVREVRARRPSGEYPSYVREVRCIRRDGTPFWTRISSAFAFDPRTSEPALRVSIIEDIDDRYRAEAELLKANAHLTQALAERAGALRALEQSEAMFRASFEGAAVGKVLTDPLTRCYVRVNRAFADMLGHEPEHFVGRTVAEFTWPEDRHADVTGFALLMSGDTPAFVREKRLLRRDGEPFWARISAKVVDTADSVHPVLVVVVVEDIDSRYEAEAELRTAKHALELLAEQRRAALVQRDLLLREVYHRVKNNLQIVDGLLTMQARQLEDPRAKRALLGLRGRIYALGLVHQQLMGSADLKTFDVAPFLEVLSKNIIEGGAEAGRIALSVEACPIRADLDFAIPLGLLVTELVTNSLKHAFPGGAGAISVTLRPGADGEVVLVVSDNGQPQPRDGAGNRPASGLGLRIIDGLVAQLGGSMTVRHEGGTSTEIRTAMPPQP